MLCLQLKKYWY